MKKYLLLTPLTGAMFGISNAQLINCLHQDKCGHIVSTDNRNNTTVIYAVASSPDLLAVVCDKNNLDGNVVEYTGVYDMCVEEVAV